ncbi:hypothetical protein [Tenacibaculum singaporense]|uniref:hypothetical protein n=1 Tax=Tenacibaculum singaporense TaxID=2358479 RepID=UPI000F680AD4|nr:hypothetical protein [Tenacibaculum singaporense]RSC92588.1 hypothetical protein EI424_14180 [Tenacibaculum singaporense]
MNLVVIDNEKNEYQNFIGLTEEKKEKIRKKVIKINDKLEKYLCVKENEKTEDLDEKYNMNNSLLELYTNLYNETKSKEEKNKNDKNRRIQE